MSVQSCLPHRPRVRPRRPRVRLLGQPRVGHQGEIALHCQERAARRGCARFAGLKGERPCSPCSGRFGMESSRSGISTETARAPDTPQTLPLAGSRRSSGDGSSPSSDSSGPWRAQASDDGRPSESASEYAMDFDSPRTEASEDGEVSVPRQTAAGALGMQRQSSHVCNGSARDRRTRSWRCDNAQPRVRSCQA